MKLFYCLHLPLWVATMMFAMTCCSSRGKEEVENAENTFSRHVPCRSVYWWKTVYDPDSVELSFLSEHDVGRIYVRYFDIIYDPANKPEPIVPNATLQFRQPFPDSLEIVPTVFITNETMANMPDDWMMQRPWYDQYKRFHSIAYYAQQTLYRIKAMNQRNGVKKVREVQVDCDWTSTTRDAFFYFCNELRTLLHAEGIALSATIRLHQLCMSAPPVDRGVLMCYNTGALRNISTRNSILDAADTYSHLKRYDPKYFDIPLDVAYPTFGWSVMYSKKKELVGLVKTTDLSDETKFQPTGDGTYRVVRDCAAGNAILKAGNLLRREESSVNTLLQVKKQIEAVPGLLDDGSSVILYHLDSKNLDKYSTNEIETLFR